MARSDDQQGRANGEGSIFYWDGRGWYAAITNAEGKRIQRKAPVQTKTGAEQLLRKLLKERDEGTLTSGQMTLAQFVPQYLASARARNVRPRTIEVYDDKLKTHILPTLGKVRLDKMTSARVEALYGRLLAEGKRVKAEDGTERRVPLSPASVGMVHQVLHSLLKLAKRRQLVGRVVTEDVDPPKVPKYRARTLTIEQLQTLLRVSQGHRHGAIWTFIADTGCRWGEAAGLTWADLDLEERFANIRQAATRHRTPGGTKIVIDAVKTEAGERQAPLSGWNVESLKAQRARVAEMRLLAGPRWQDQDLVFPNTIGGPLRENHVNRLWHEMLKRADLPPARMHDLRHSKGTLMIDEGEELVVVQRTLGHARQSITADLYIGKVPKALRRASDRYGELLDPRKEAAG